MRGTRKWWLGVLALAQLGGAGSAVAAICTSLTSFDWAGVGTGQWSCGGGTASDTYRIAAGHTVSIVSDVLLANQAGAGIEVLAGGTLETDHVGGLVIQLGPGGMTCRPGSVCRIKGRYRELRSAPPQPRATLEEAGHWRLDEIVPCPGSAAGAAQAQPDCAGILTTPGSPSIVRLRWPSPPNPGGAGVALPLDDVLAALVPGKDVLCFYDPSPEDLGAGAEDNHCYEIAAVHASQSPYSVDLRVEQGVLDQHGYPLARRQLAQTQLAQAVAAGARTFDVPSGFLPTVPSGRQAWVGRWLRFASTGGDCPGGPGSPCVASPGALKISRTVDGGAGLDRIEVGDPRGVPSSFPTGTTVWVDYGWAKGDPFFAMAPVRVRPASPNETGLPIVSFQGGGDVRAAVFERMRGVRIENTGLGFWQDVWLQDCVGNTSTCLSITGSVGRRYGRTCITGGSSQQLTDRTHGMHFRETSDTTAEDFAIRYGADDCSGTPGLGNDGATFRRLRCSFTSDNSQSSNFWGGNTLDGSPLTTGVLVEDALCEDCTSAHPVFVGLTFTAGVARSVLVWGTAHMIGGNPTFPFENLGVIGGTRASTSGGSFLPVRVDGFTMRDLVVPNAGGSLSSTSVLDARNGVISNVVLANPNGANIPLDGTLENIAYLDVSTTAACTGSCRLLNQNGPGDTILRRITVAQSPGVAAEFDVALRSSAASGTGLVLDGFLVDGWQGGIADFAWSLATPVMMSASFGGGPCFHDNVSDGPASVLDNLPPTAVRGVAPGFVDPAVGRFDTLPGSPADVAGCGVRRGAQAPGVRGHPWAWRISGLPPERMADDPDGDGVPQAPGSPRCTSGDQFGCGDVCPGVYDPLQRDTDGDGVGDACDDHCLGTDTVITQVTPTTPKIGAALQIDGTGFSPTATVRFGEDSVAGVIDAGHLFVIVPPLRIGVPVALQVVNPEGCASQQEVIVVPEAPVAPSCGLIGGELVLLLWLRRRRRVLPR